jgi:serine/threonine protein kinase
VEVMNAILKQEPPELEGMLPPSLDRIIRRCLEKKPEERFHSARRISIGRELRNTTGSGPSLSSEASGPGCASFTRLYTRETVPILRSVRSQISPMLRPSLRSLQS